MCSAWPTDQSCVLLQKRKETSTHDNSCVLFLNDVNWRPGLMRQNQSLTNNDTTEHWSKATKAVFENYYCEDLKMQDQSFFW